MSKYDNGLKYDFKIEDGGMTYDYRLYQLVINLFESIYMNDESKEIITYLLKTERVALTDDMIAMAFPSMTDSLRTTDADGLNLSVFIEHLESIGVLQDFAYLLATIMLIENNLNVREEITSFVQVMLEEKSAIMEYVKSDLYSGTILNFVMNRYGKTTELTVKGSLELDGNTFSNVNGDLTVYASNSSGTVTDSITYNDVTLNSIGAVYDYILDGDRYYNIGVRDYESGDDNLRNVVTNGTITYYVRSETLIEPNGTKYVAYEGEFITANNSSLGLTDGLEVRGKTYQNLARLDLDASELFYVFNGGTLIDGVITVVSDGAANMQPFYTYNKQMYKPSTTYTIVVNVLENTFSEGTLYLSYTYTSIGSTSQSIFNANTTINPLETGVIKFTSTTKDDISECSIVLRTQFSNTLEGEYIKYSFMILEGDYTNVDLPESITGIESVSGDMMVKSVGDNQSHQVDFGNFTGRSIGDYFDYRTKDNDVKLIEKVVLDGTEIWVKASSVASEEYLRFYTTSFNVLVGSKQFCDILPYGQLNMATYGGEGIGTAGNNRLNFVLLKSSLISEDLAGFRAWLAENTPTVYYVLAEPIITPLENPTTELSTYDGTTHVFSENSNVEPEIYARILTVDEDRYTEINELELLESATTITSSGTTIQPNLSFYIETSDVELFALASLAEQLGFTEVKEMFVLLKYLESVGISDLDDPRTAYTDWYIGQDSSNDNRFNTWLVPFDMLVDPRQSDFNIMPPVEHTQIDLPYTDGSIFQDTKYTNRIFNLVSYSAQGLSTSQKEELKTQIVELLASTKDEPKRLTNLNNNLTFDVRYSGELGFEEAPSWIKATIPLETKPYGYKQFSEIISGDGIIVNDGHADLGVKVEISGGCDTPNFTIGGTEFTWNSTVPSDETLVIDNENKTCYLKDALGNKTQALKYLTDGTSFRTIPKGNQAVVQCLNDSTKSHLTIEYQPKYLWKGADLADE